MQPKKSFGPIIGIIVIIIVIIVGGLYFWGSKVNTLTPTDEVSDIQKDLGAGNDLNVDLSDIEASLQ
jgi:hypothetical protein